MDVIVFFVLDVVWKKGYTIEYSREKNILCLPITEHIAPPNFAHILKRQIMWVILSMVKMGKIRHLIRRPFSNGTQNDKRALISFLNNNPFWCYFENYITVFQYRFLQYFLTVSRGRQRKFLLLHHSSWDSSRMWSRPDSTNYLLSPASYDPDTQY